MQKSYHAFLRRSRSKGVKPVYRGTFHIVLIRSRHPMIEQTWRSTGTIRPLLRIEYASAAKPDYFYVVANLNFQVESKFR